MLELNVYDNQDNIIKTVKAKPLDLRMGTVRKLNQLIPLEKTRKNADITRIIYNAWSELTDILNIMFPDMTDEDWDGVKATEVMALVLEIGGISVSKALTIPTSGKVKN